MVLSELLPFLRFLNKQFDRFDHYQARVLFAKSGDFEFIENVGGEKIKLKEFYPSGVRQKKRKELYAIFGQKSTHYNRCKCRWENDAFKVHPVESFIFGQIYDSDAGKRP